MQMFFFHASQEEKWFDISFHIYSFLLMLTLMCVYVCAPLKQLQGDCVKRLNRG